MKKFLITILLNFFFCSNSFAIIINLGCGAFQSYNTSTQLMDKKFEGSMLLRIDTNALTMVSILEKEIVRTWLIKEISDSFFYSDEASDYDIPDHKNALSLNRYTGELVFKHKRSNIKYYYICSKTNQVF